ncbi:MAG: SCO family protein [Acidimicrobiaceae bacterium]|nr:SCO family protein [Acidimicrobiaceae bacterium]
MADDVLEAHLARCPDCTQFAEAAAAEHRRLRVRPASPVPDLTEEILERLATMPPPAAAGDRRLRRRLASLAAATAVVVGGGFGAGALLGAHLGSGGRRAGTVAIRQVAGAPQTSSRYPGAIVTSAGVPKPGVVLTDTAGRPYDLARATAGRVTLVYFGYTHCPDLCPINMALTAAALRDLPAADRRKITVVFISTDPARDTRQVIRSWLARFDPSFVGLTGSLAAIHEAEVQVHMPLSYLDRATSPRSASATETGQDYLVVHSAYTLVYAPDGWANLTVDDSVRPDQYATTLSHVLSYGFRRST